jgi:glutathione S-transferase
MIVLHETGLTAAVSTVRSVVAASEPNAVLQADNPLSKIPTLVLDDGTPLYDSRVICEYLDALHSGPTLCPRDGAERWTTLRRQALGDGFLDALLLWRQEKMRAPEQRFQALLTAFDSKATAALSVLEAEAGELGTAPFAIGHISIGCALSYLDFRFSDLDWREGRSQLTAWHREFESRPSVAATRVVDELQTEVNAR